MQLSALAESDKGKEEMKKPQTSGALPPALVYWKIQLALSDQLGLVSVCFRLRVLHCQQLGCLYKQDVS